MPIANDLRAAYAEHEREVTIANFKVACILGMVLMPAGALLDYFVYPDKLWDFFELRLVCSSLIGFFLAFLLTPMGRRLYRLCGLILLMLPTFFMSVMIYETEGTRSPYYAGLNLVVLMLGFVLHWSFWESLIAVASVVGMYLVACLLHGDPRDTGIFFNNLYFLTLTGIIVVTGSYFLSGLRFSDYAARYELARQKAQLERALAQLQEAESQLVQSENLAALGRMSAGMIHEINNPLNYVQTGLYGLRQRVLEFPATARADWENLLAAIEDGVGRVQNIVADLGPFARDRDAACDALPAAELVEMALRFIRHACREQVRIEQQIEPGLTAWANQVRLVQVLVNLLQNALDALAEHPPAGGAAAIVITGRRQGDRCLLAVRDNGPGIPPEIQGKIFEPFFTTKEVGKGVGLGLHICRRIVQQHDGTIRVSSQPGAGCEFVLDLPATEPAAAANLSRQPS